jgi:hypothetical protein
VSSCCTQRSPVERRDRQRSIPRTRLRSSSRRWRSVGAARRLVRGRGQRPCGQGRRSKRLRAAAPYRSARASPRGGCRRSRRGCAGFRCSGSTGRVLASVETALVGDYDEHARRVRLRTSTTKTRAALWVDLPDALADAIEATFPPRGTAIRWRRSSRVSPQIGSVRPSLGPARPPPGCRSSLLMTFDTAGSRCFTVREARGPRSDGSSASGSSASRRTPTRTF